MNDGMGQIGNTIWDTIGYNGNMPFGAIKHGWECEISNEHGGF
jgi:hypothetical protein